MTSPTKTDTPELDAAMARYADGDDSAFSEIFALVAPRLTRFLRRLTGALPVAEDLLQETLIRLHRARGSYTGGPVLPWVYAIARNVYIDYGRASRARRQDRFVDAEDGALDRHTADANSSGEASAIARQAAAAIDRELQRMTPARREAFVLLRYEGMSVADAAALLGTTETAVKLRAFHAYEQLRRVLGEQ